MAIALYTARYQYPGEDRLDITRQGNDRLRQGGKPTPGEVLAPSWDILNFFRAKMKAAGQDDEARQRTFAEYSKVYLDELRHRYRRRRSEWMFILQEQRTLVCFCPEPTFCHRSIAIDALVKSSMGAAENCGEKPVLVPIVCHIRWPKRALCNATPGCTRRHVALCDYPVERKGKKGTCDIRMCERCRWAVPDAHDTDYCPAHRRYYLAQPHQLVLR